MFDGDVRLPKVQLDEPLRVQARHFLDRIAGLNGDGHADGLEGVKVIRVLEAIARSLEAEGAPVALAVHADDR